MIRQPPRSPLLPYPTPFRSGRAPRRRGPPRAAASAGEAGPARWRASPRPPPRARGAPGAGPGRGPARAWSRRLRLVVLVADLTEQLLEQVLHGDQPGDAAVLVDHQREMDLAAAELAKDVACAHAERHEGRRAGGRLPGGGRPARAPRPEG